MVFLARAKDESIETLRGIAILLVISGYATHALVRETALTTGISFLYHLLTPVRLPLFTVISGFLYAALPASKSSYSKLMRGKARRVLVPFAAMSAIQYFVYAHLENKSLSFDGFVSAYTDPLHQLWFLLAVFWIFLLAGALDACGALSTFGRWCGATAAALILHVAWDPPSFFSIAGIVYLTPFFLLGYGLRRYGARLLSPRNVGFASQIAAGSCVLYAALYVHHHVPKAVYEGLGALISFAAIPIAFHLRPRSRICAFLGHFAFTIHLFSYLMLPLANHLLVPGTWPTVVIFTGTIAIIVGLPILLQRPMESWNVTRVLLLGMKPKENDEPLEKPYPLPYRMPITVKRRIVTYDRQFFQTRPSSKRRARIDRLKKQLIDI